MAENFLKLSDSFVGINSNASSRKRLERLYLIIGLLEDDYQKLSLERQRVLAILKAKGREISMPHLFAELQFIRELVNFLKSEEKDEMKKKIQEKGERDVWNRLRIATQAFEKDRITSWEKVQELIHPELETEAPKAKPVFYLPKSETSEAEKPESENEEVTGEDNEISRVTAEIAGQISFLIDKISKSRIREKELRGEVHECFDLLEINKSQLERATGQVADLVRKNNETGKKLEEIEANLQRAREDFRGKSKEAEGLAAERDELKLKLREKNQRITELEKQLEEVRRETPADLIQQLKETLALAKNQLQFPSRSDCTKEVSHKFKDLPRKSRFYNVPTIYVNEFRDSFNTFNKQARKVLTSGVKIVCEMGSQHNSLKAEKIRKPSRKSHIPDDAITGWANEELRLVWKLTSTALVFYDCYHKNKCPLD